MTNNVTLGSEQIAQLRQNKLLSTMEVAFIVGDLIVAENITSGEKRVIGEVSSILTEANKRVLKG